MKEKQLYLFGFNRDSAKNTNQYKVILPLDMLILLGVSALILLVLFFCLGIEKGKRIALRDSGLKTAAVQEAAPAEAVENKEQAEAGQSEGIAAEQAAEIKQEENLQQYYIQVASFQKEKSALQEADRLEKDGCPILTVQRGSYIVIYVGGYSDKKEAKNKLAELKKKYKDCILRRL